MIRLDSLTLRYPNRFVAETLSMEIPSGEADTTAAETTAGATSRT